MTRRPALTPKQALDLITMMKALVVTSAEYVIAAPDSKEKEQKWAAYQNSLDNAEDYIQSLTITAPPAVVPPKAAP